MIPGYSLAQGAKSLVMHNIDNIENHIYELKVSIKNLENKLEDTENQKTDYNKNIESVKNDLNVLSEKIKKTEAMINVCGKEITVVANLSKDIVLLSAKIGNLFQDEQDLKNYIESDIYQYIQSDFLTDCQKIRVQFSSLAIQSCENIL
jgi:chromosome segregation ATPase